MISVATRARTKVTCQSRSFDEQVGDADGAVAVEVAGDSGGVNILAHESRRDNAHLVDLPAAAVPLSMDRGRPLSVQIVAATGREDLVLSVAAQLEQLVPWVRHAPDWGVVGDESRR